MITPLYFNLASTFGQQLNEVSRFIFYGYEFELFFDSSNINNAYDYIILRHTCIKLTWGKFIAILNHIKATKKIHGWLWLQAKIQNNQNRYLSTTLIIKRS